MLLTCCVVMFVWIEFFFFWFLSSFSSVHGRRKVLTSQSLLSNKFTVFTNHNYVFWILLFRNLWRFNSHLAVKLTNILYSVSSAFINWNNAQRRVGVSLGIESLVYKLTTLIVLRVEIFQKKPKCWENSKLFFPTGSALVIRLRV